VGGWIANKRAPKTHRIEFLRLLLCWCGLWRWRLAARGQPLHGEMTANPD
jgi:hypothetical protein